MTDFAAILDDTLRQRSDAMTCAIMKNLDTAKVPATPEHRQKVLELRKEFADMGEAAHTMSPGDISARIKAAFARAESAH